MKYWLIALALLLNACSSAPGNVRYYLISDADTPATDTCPLRLGRLEMPGYLARTNIIVSTADNVLVPAHQHLWSEPLSNGTRRVLSQCLGPGGEPVDVEVLHFHGSTNAQTVLEANWQVRGGESRTFEANRTQPGSGYDVLVSTQRALLEDLCRSICAVSRQQSSQ